MYFCTLSFMLKYILLISGLFFVGLGFVGVAIPGLPTTPFLLLAAACFIRSSDRLYNWIINHKTFGKFIQDYQNRKVIPLRIKIIAISAMSIMVLYSSLFLIDNIPVSIVIVLAGLVGAIFILMHKSG